MGKFEIAFCALGAFFLICFFVDWKKAASKAKKMKFDPDWINFILATLIAAFAVLAGFTALKEAIFGDSF